MSKFLPVQDLSVEEVIEREPDPAIRFDQRFDLPEPKRAPRMHRKRGKGYAINLHAGANAIIMAAFSDGEMHASSDCYPALHKAGYSTNGMYGRFERLERHGLISSPGYGKWQLTPKGKKVWEQPPATAKESAA
jgi:hypothetical protein